MQQPDAPPSPDSVNQFEEPGKGALDDVDVGRGHPETPPSAWKPCTRAMRRWTWTPARSPAWSPAWARS